MIICKSHVLVKKSSQLILRHTRCKYTYLQLLKSLRLTIFTTPQPYFTVIVSVAPWHMEAYSAMITPVSLIERSGIVELIHILKNITNNLYLRQR